MDRLSGNAFARYRGGIAAVLIMILALAAGCGTKKDRTTTHWSDSSATKSTAEPETGLGPAESAKPSPTASAQPSPTASRQTSPTPTSSTHSPTRSTSPRQTGPWSVVVDNSTPGRFTASSAWSQATNSSQRYGSDFRSATPYVEKSDASWYKVAIPETATYRVEVWFPASSGHNDRTPYVVVTANGNQTVHVNQRTNGGRWVALGTFTLTAGDENKVGVSRWTAGTGRVVADAIRITRV